MIRLGKRLKIISSLIPEGSTVCDVGCDHGKLCVYGLVTKQFARALCVDISPYSLQKAKLLAESYGIESIMFCVSDGLKSVELDKYTVGGRLADVLVVSGLGGYNIIGILRTNKYSFDKYIFVPHQDSAVLRKYLADNYEIISDFCIKDKRFYDIIICSDGMTCLTDLEAEFGKDNLKSISGDFREKLLFLKDFYENILDKAESKKIREKLGAVERLLRK